MNCYNCLKHANLTHTPVGSLLNLAKYPASTVQILGAEKALFRLASISVKEQMILPIHLLIRVILYSFAA